MLASLYTMWFLCIQSAIYDRCARWLLVCCAWIEQIEYHSRRIEGIGHSPNASKWCDDCCVSLIWFSSFNWRLSLTYPRMAMRPGIANVPDTLSIGHQFWMRTMSMTSRQMHLGQRKNAQMAGYTITPEWYRLLSSMWVPFHNRINLTHGIHIYYVCVEKFDLVCDHDIYPTVGLAALNTGGPIGVYLFGIINDRLGRRVAYFTCLGTLLIGSLLTAISINFWMWAISRVIVGLTIPAVYQIPFIIGILFLCNNPFCSFLQFFFYFFLLSLSLSQTTFNCLSFIQLLNW